METRIKWSFKNKVVLNFGTIDNVELVGNEAKEQISKRMLQENRERHMFRKTNISYSLICTRTCVFQGVRNVYFSEYLVCFVFL